MTQEKLNKVLELHKKWIDNEEGGERASLLYANLDGADLDDTYLDGADLRGAYLRNTDLRRSHLRETYLRGAYLRDADLRGADLRGSYLRDADLRGTDLDGAKNIHSWQCGEGNRVIYSVRHETCVMHKAGCFWGNTEEFVQRIREKYGENSAYERLAIIYDEMLIKQ